MRVYRVKLAVREAPAASEQDEFVSVMVHTLDVHGADLAAQAYWEMVKEVIGKPKHLYHRTVGVVEVELPELSYGPLPEIPKV